MTPGEQVLVLWRRYRAHAGHGVHEIPYAFNRLGSPFCAAKPSTTPLDRTDQVADGAKVDGLDEVVLEAGFA